MLHTVSAPAAASVTGLFAATAGTAAAQNCPDHGLISSSNPIAAGGTIIASLTGTGAVIPAGAIADGAATSASLFFNAVAECGATFGGITAQVGLLGMTPEYVGLAQANITVQAGVASGSNALPVTKAPPLGTTPICAKAHPLRVLAYPATNSNGTRPVPGKLARRAWQRAQPLATGSWT